ncbi:Crp/Fnr family transcriptional regulator [Hamadaea sp. NPDC050747]|uniref:Crp/Fnr family transcriptional regulator n=1 Tax=Hamadaea sp. NPDC050747 TaxID=3155789 RepID=UPI0033D3B1B6
MSEQKWLPGTLLGRLDETSRKALLALGVPKTVAAGSPIIREGHRETFVVLLIDAVAKVTAAMADGRPALLSIRMSGDIVGEMSALNEVPRSATVTACRPSAVRVIYRDEFREYMRTRADAAVEIAGTVADRLRWANRRRMDFAAYPVKVRLARVLAEMSAAYGRRGADGIVVSVDLTQAELATLCGAASMSVQKALRELRQANLVETGYRRIVVRDLAVLRELADAAV